MKARFFLFITIILFSSVVFADKSDTSAAEWKAAGLSTDIFISLLSEECMISKKSFLGCYTAINTPLIYKKKLIRLYPNAILKDPRYNVFKVIETGMFFSWVQVQTLTKIKSKTETKAEEENSYTSIFKIYDQFIINGLTTNKIFPKLYKKSLAYSNLEDTKNPEDALIASYSFNDYYYFAVDPHASIRIKKDFDGKNSFTGIGIQYYKNHDKKFVITKVLKNFPAINAGIRTGDIIIGVNGATIENLTTQGLYELISDGNNNKIDLKILRNLEILNISVKRKKVELPNIDIAFTNNYITLKINNFMDDNLCSDVEAQLATFENNAVKGLILDLRDNPGGLVNQAVCLTSLFVGTKKTILITKSIEDGTELKMKEEEKHKHFKYPMIVMINTDSASASEIVSGALQDYKRAWVVGERSFGKGSIQGEFYFNNEEKIIFWKTIGRFYMPSGRTNQIHGIIPDFEISHLSKEVLADLPREEDLYYGTITDDKFIPWTQSRVAEVSQINLCLSKNEKLKVDEDLQWQRSIQILDCIAK